MSQVNLNGALSFDAGFGIYTPVPYPIDAYSIIAPYWADVDVTANNGRLYYRSTTGTSESVSHITLIIVKWRKLPNFIDYLVCFQRNIVLISVHYRHLSD